MARGKAAAQAANRRLSEALERVAELEQKLSDRESAHRVETTELRVALDRAVGATNREVKRLADDRVTAARDEANAAIKAAHDNHLGLVVAGLARLRSIPTVKLEVERVAQWTDVAESFGVDVGPMLAGLNPAGATRHLARTSNASARWKAEIFEATERGEMYDPGRRSAWHDANRWREP